MHQKEIRFLAEYSSKEFYCYLKSQVEWNKDIIEIILKSEWITMNEEIITVSCQTEWDVLYLPDLKFTACLW